METCPLQSLLTSPKVIEILHFATAKLPTVFCCNSWATAQSVESEGIPTDSKGPAPITAVGGGNMITSWQGVKKGSGECWMVKYPCSAWTIYLSIWFYLSICLSILWLMVIDYSWTIYLWFGKINGELSIFTMINYLWFGKNGENR